MTQTCSMPGTAARASSATEAWWAVSTTRKRTPASWVIHSTCSGELVS